MSRKYLAGAALALVMAAAPLSGASACLHSGASEAECVARCARVEGIWDSALCALGAAPAPQQHHGAPHGGDGGQKQAR
ncbi:hypothetical protein ACFFJB_09085 [Camelimonas abortus]|uniref:Lipoprotein n=1 Tax=Camelimonas abortus TaxID=1017184 RepID=A0ABV7LEF1_9HYPH